MNHPVRTAALLLLAACSPEGSPDDPAKARQAKPSTDARATRVEVAVMTASKPKLEIMVPGEVEGYRDATLASPQGGYVERVSVKVGDEVPAGRSLAWIDRTVYNTALVQAKAELDQAEAQLRRTKSAGSAVSRASREGAEFRARAARASYQLAEIRARTAKVTAPFAGVVAAVEVEQGEVLPPGGAAVRLVQLDPIKVSTTVSDRDVVNLKPGLEVVLRPNARAEVITGQIARVSPAADLNTRAFEVTIEVANAERRLLPGMIVNVRISVELDEHVLAIPQHVLVTRREGNGVFIEREGRATWRPLDLGRVVGGQVIVRAGLSTTERVIVLGHRELADGDTVLVTREGWCCKKGRIVHGSAPGAS